jgi:predicted DNA-binding protein (MmcQ/YjbR family)
MPNSKALTRAKDALRKHALTFPQAVEEFPWGESAIKVKGKVFVFLHQTDDFLSVTVKLPESGATAVGLPFAQPSGYGLGKSGWVTSRFEPAAAVPLDLLKEWVGESFRAVAPKKVLAALEQAPAAGPPGQSRAKK